MAGGFLNKCIYIELGIWPANILSPSGFFFCLRKSQASENKNQACTCYYICSLVYWSVCECDIFTCRKFKLDPCKTHVKC